MRITENTKWGDLDPDLKKLDNTGGRYTDELNTFCNNVLSVEEEEESYADVLYKKWQIAEAKVVELQNKIKRLDKDLGELIRQLES